MNYETADLQETKAFPFYVTRIEPASALAFKIAIEENNTNYIPLKVNLNGTVQVSGSPLPNKSENKSFA